MGYTLRVSPVVLCGSDQGVGPVAGGCRQCCVARRRA